MEYRRFENTYVVRLDRGDEILESLAAFCEKEDIRLGYATGLGAVDHFVAGLYDVAAQSYHKMTFDGQGEITSLIGNISRQEGKVYLHFHIAVSNDSGAVAGGHLNEGRISGTAEIFVTRLEGEVGRKKDDVIGLNVMQFE